MQDESLELSDVTITIPLRFFFLIHLYLGMKLKPFNHINLQHILLRVGPGVPPPVVAECDGEYFHNTKLSALQWKLPLIDASNKSGSMEFTASGTPDDFFPVNVSFVTQKAYSDITVSEQEMIQNSLYYLVIEQMTRQFFFFFSHRLWM